ncbi:MAG: DUF4384 domain-containing protein [Deltaproteobacteria bacterium]|nr:DUF4384 domain-containing protein [Deltaproteobacteria bacterium]
MMPVENRRDVCLSHLRCDQLLNGELGHAAEATSRAHLAECVGCATRLEAHVQERARFAVPRRVPRSRRGIATAMVVAAAAVVVGVVVLRRSPRDEVVAPLGDAATTRVKGAPSIGFYVKHREVVRPGAPGEIVAPGDALDFTASIDHPAYLAIVSIDGAQVASVYYPAGDRAAPVAPGQAQVLPQSVVLDDVLGRERVYGVFCDRALAVDEIKAAIARDARPPGCVVDALTIEKRR